MRKIVTKIIITLLVLAMLPVVSINANAEGEKLIAITFDDGPSRYTSALLDGLKARGAYATFFMTGVNGNSGVTNYPELVNRMWEEGHQLANHTYSHATLTNVSVNTMQDQIGGVQQFVFDRLGGSYSMMLRTPGGATNSTVKAYCGMPIILWSVDPLDWKYKDEDRVYNQVVSGAKDGAIILLHDLYKTSCDAALRAIDTLQSQGYTFVTVSELLRRKCSSVSNGQVFYSVSGDTLLAPYSTPEIQVIEDKTAGQARVTMSSPDGLTLYYTTDGTYPYLNSHMFTGEAIPLETDTTFTVIGVDAYGTRTPAVVTTVKAAVAPSAPVMSLENGLLTLTPSTEGSAIYYTCDGSDPRENGKYYTDPLSPSGTVKCVAVNSAGYWSEVTSCNFTKYGDMIKDVAVSDWYYDAVGEVIHRNIMSGVGDYMFDPNGNTSRAMMVTSLYQLAVSLGMDENEDAAAAPMFADVAEDAWYYEAVSWAESNGVVDGVGDGLFDPDGLITRQQMALMIYRFAVSADVNTGIENTADFSQFDDASEISDYANEAMAWAVSNGLLMGSDGRIEPNEQASRAQCAEVLIRLLNQIETAQENKPNIDIDSEAMSYIPSLFILCFGVQGVKRVL